MVDPSRPSKPSQREWESGWIVGSIDWASLSEDFSEATTSLTRCVTHVGHEKRHIVRHTDWGGSIHSNGSVWNRQQCGTDCGSAASFIIQMPVRVTHRR